MVLIKWFDIEILHICYSQCCIHIGEALAHGESELVRNLLLLKEMMDD